MEEHFRFPGVFQTEVVWILKHVLSTVRYLICAHGFWKQMGATLAHFHIYTLCPDAKLKPNDSKHHKSLKWGEHLTFFKQRENYSHISRCFFFFKYLIARGYYSFYVFENGVIIKGGDHSRQMKFYSVPRKTIFSYLKRGGGVIIQGRATIQGNMVNEISKRKLQY